ncbi:glycosyltransferase family 4 protein [Patescibacteria group bacterium]|nr:glycosyltransferase family 4 protein [Patescibacteria group bacterium]
MKAAIDVSPLQTGHKVRGAGFYLDNLKKALEKYFPDNEYTFFTRGESLPKSVELVHFPYFEPFFLALPIYKKYKTIVTVHDLTPIFFSKNFPRGIKGELKWQMQRYALKKANAIITDSESSKKDITKYVGVGEGKVNVIYLAAGEDFKKLGEGKWKEEVQKKYKLPDKFILYVGDVTWNKNLPRFLEAVKKTELPLVMVGKALVSEDYDRNNPWNNDLVRVQQEAEANPKVLRIGFVPTEDLVGIYNLATVFVMPSLYEGFGLPILEAMASGCPVITTKEGSLPEVAGEAAFYVEAEDVDNIAEGIEKVFNDNNLRKELSIKGLERVKKFSWKKTAEETLEVYKKVLSK